MRYYYYSMNNVMNSLGFGKYKDTQMIHVIMNDIDYVAWMKEQNWITFSPTLVEFIKSLYQQMNSMEIDDIEVEELCESYLKIEQESKVVEERKQEEQEKEIGYVESLEELLGRKEIIENKNVIKNEWLKNIVQYFNLGMMLRDTKAGRIKWIIVEKKETRKNKYVIWGANAPMGMILLLREEKNLIDGSKCVENAFITNDKKEKYRVTSLDKGDIEILLQCIEKMSEI